MAFFAFSGAGAVMPATATATVLDEPPSISVALTGYNAVPGQTDDNPLETASGAFSNPEIIVARSQDLAATLPFGTIVAFHAPASPLKQGGCGYDVAHGSIGYRIVADSMNKKFTNRMDVLFPTTEAYRLDNGSAANAAVVLGVCEGVTATVVGHLDVAKMNSWPKTQAALAALVEGTSQTLAVK